MRDWLKNWLRGIVFVAAFLIAFGMICGAFYGEALLLHHHTVIGIAVGIVLILLVGGLIISWVLGKDWGSY